MRLDDTKNHSFHHTDKGFIFDFTFNGDIKKGRLKPAFFNAISYQVISH